MTGRQGPPAAAYGRFLRSWLNDPLAVGALLVHIAPNLEPDAIRQILERTIATALERKVLREEAAPRVDEGGEAEPPAEPAPDVTAPPSPEDVDAGWET